MRILANQLACLGNRFFHVGLPNLCHKGPGSPINKTLLLKLRKRTGYTFSNCKKALEQNGYNLEKAEQWLKLQAQALGWSKATKLEGRPTAQGLVAVAVDKQDAVIVELNCETDFVARNKAFVAMVEDAVKACFQFAAHQPIANTITKINLDSERLRVLPVEGGNTLSDQLALVIGNVGENLSLRRATCLKVGPGMRLAGYAHPAPTTASPAGSLLGKYGALVAFRGTSSPGNSAAPHVGRELCQHVVGMNPLKIGVEGEDLPTGDPDSESCLIYQEYLLDPTQTVAQLVAANQIEVVAFTRFECGEALKEEMPIDLAIEQGG